MRKKKSPAIRIAAEKTPPPMPAPIFREEEEVFDWLFEAAGKEVDADFNVEVGDESVVRVGRTAPG